VCAEKLFSVLDRAVEKLQKKPGGAVSEIKDGAARVPLVQIRFLEVRQNYVTVHAEEDYTIKKRLANWKNSSTTASFASADHILSFSENQPVAGAFARRDGAFTAEILLPQ
jgi:hypothetical protein